MNTLILAGGKIDMDFVRNRYEETTFEKIIAVDGGLEAADKLGIFPTDIVGDFDTVDTTLLKKYENQQDVTIHRFQPEKDMTDSQIGMELAISYKSSNIILLGATGSRIDHMLGNISLLLMPLKAGIPAYLWDKTNRIRMIANSITLKKKDQYGTYISLLPFTDLVKEMTLKGFKYPLQQYTMSKMDSFTIGVSNELLKEEGEIEFKEGILLLIESMDF